MELQLSDEMKKNLKDASVHKPIMPTSSLRPPRKNLPVVAKIINALIEEGMETVSSADIWFVIQKLGPKEVGFKLKQDQLRMDQHGPVRSIGDILGGHGLQMEKAGRGRYAIPEDGITEEYLSNIGINPNHRDFS